MHDGDPINPQRLFWELSSRLPDNAIMAADSGPRPTGSPATSSIREGHDGLAVRQPRHHVPGRALRHRRQVRLPDPVVIAFVGDGAMQMLGNSALITIAKYWRQWSDPRCVIAVLNNGTSTR
jgi:pyruvate dehydrogenase (quinone)